MSFSIEELLIALFLILPGFVTTLLQRVFHPKLFDSGLEWTAVSLLRSLLLNGVVVLLAILSKEFSAALTLERLKEAVKTTTLGELALYFLGLYLLAALWGVALGRFPALTPQHWARRFKWTTVTRYTSIWNQVIHTRLDRDASLKPWLRLKLKDGREVLGRLRDSSLIVDRDKPIEIFMSPVYHITDKGPVEIESTDALQFKGTYFRLEPDTPLDFYVADRGWRPPDGMELLRRPPAPPSANELIQTRPEAS
ncbi:MAG: DUF6338 family protein [Pseudomonadota bacterium]